MRQLKRPDLIAAFLMIASFGPAQAQTQRVDLPIRDVPLDSGQHLYSILIKVGATEIEAGLDTGSPGLRVFPGTLSPTDVQQGGSVADANFSSGVRYEGNSATGTLALGTLNGSVKLEAINVIECQPDRTDCPASHISPSNYGIRGDSLTGGRFRAIIGINTTQNEIRSPLLQMGVNRWIVTLPRSGETGHLILNPTDQEITDFVRLPRLDSQRGALRDAVEGCIIDAKKRSSCGPLLLDSGAPNIRLINANAADSLTAGAPAAFAFLKSDQPVAAEQIVIGQSENGTQFRTDGNRARFTTIIAGTVPFLAFDVLYDQGTNEIGLRPRQPINGRPIGQVVPQH